MYSFQLQIEKKCGWSQRENKDGTQQISHDVTFELQRGRRACVTYLNLKKARRIVLIQCFLLSNYHINIGDTMVPL